MNHPLTPTNIEELTEAVRSTSQLIAVGRGTKPRLSEVDCRKLSTRRLSGIVEYNPSEFTFTALAGTPVGEIAAALAERGQYLPFDPMWVKAGATIGGTLASGVSGPGRFRFGGLRDFVLGVRFVDGSGRLLRLGGKVVKNAAGFDVPKFLVGSLGRFGVLAEITFKVFPRPASWLTVMLDVAQPENAAKIFTEAGSSRWEVDALDWLPDGKAIALRLGGPAAALDLIAHEILNRWPGKLSTADEAEALWSELREASWLNTGALFIKVPLATGGLVALQHLVSNVAGARMHVSAGGNVAYLSLNGTEQAATLDAGLRQQKLSGLTLRGNAPLWFGARSQFKIAGAVKAALDPDSRFPDLDD